MASPTAQGGYLGTITPQAGKTILSMGLISIQTLKTARRVMGTI